jgi:hypothetical protein
MKITSKKILWTAEQAAADSGMSLGHFRRLAFSRDNIKYVKINRKYFITDQDYQAWKAQNTKQAD